MADDDAFEKFKKCTVEVLHVAQQPSLEFDYWGVCAYASTFDYSG